LPNPDDRPDHANDLETTLYVPAAAHLDQPDAFRRGLDALMALLLVLLPLTVDKVRILVSAGAAGPIEPVQFTSGAPPRATPWRNQPPKTAPPLTA
jgi:hypothetical protein